ncbi:MAG: protein-L-isoaspartate(D-aspartate) O-methyltransferase [Gammaproteobacteria bacterium]|nr:protein-L-isoaspartate(D-aspartate) O-methyltransferase [Gammaproteobacteria bacterium]NIM73946.1 protein-L-isoaspartate(D-aspartate) O-methyltransferase [Gammaproteobacteria bacterium]NIN38134.1 protein-L-isoaspartate(D-aspartate) O-methyltransferase [Gammaproteobacteria bacterium]NIO25727.1 protein-L-isoaspartate(D-aspartate) O-methyltransferase [Gammaproteobacteria bacterium]NIO66361.1 protein-L-isoaspartate(D-aspartate) O-methyltransferase [Gammaproteobacteria bacterium]
MTSARTRDRLIARLREEGIRDEKVLAAMRAVPRHIFVDEALASRAYEDTALPIGAGQTISQPYIVARMTEALVEGKRLRKVLEVGSGCGYQTAVLAALVERVYSVERLASLVAPARERLYALGIRNVRMRHADGFAGWPAHAPFDGILVAAAPGYVPPALIEQLELGGRLVIPVGGHGAQRLLRLTRTEEGVDEEMLAHVSFVPLITGTG